MIDKWGREKNAVSSWSSLQCVSRTPSQARRDDIAVRYFSKDTLSCCGVCVFGEGLSFRRVRNARGSLRARVNDIPHIFLFFPRTDTSRRIKQLPFDATRMLGICGQLVCRLLFIVSAYIPSYRNRICLPVFSTNHQYTPLHHQSFHYEFQHSHPAVNPDAYSLNSLHHSAVLPAAPSRRTSGLHQPSQRPRAQVFVPGRAAAGTGLSGRVPQAWPVTHEPRLSVRHAPRAKTAARGGSGAAAGGRWPTGSLHLTGISTVQAQIHTLNVSAAPSHTHARRLQRRWRLQGCCIVTFTARAEEMIARGLQQKKT